jgi:long-chain acyl-CoA synthetase
MKELAAANSIPAPDDIKDLLDNEKFQDIVLKEVQAAGRKGGLAGIELVSGVVLVHEEWTPQNVSLYPEGSGAEQIKRCGDANTVM